MFRRLLLGAVGFCLFSAVSASAQPHTLTGTVFGGGSPLAGATIEALNDGTTTVAAQTVTNASGGYALPLADGTYDLRVAPPTGSGFGQETVQDIVIAGADRIYDVILLAAGGSLHGVVKGYGGQAVANANVYVYSTNWQFIGSVVSDATGAYSIPVSAGAVNLSAGIGYPASAAAPTSWSLSRSNVSISGSTAFDLILPVVKVSGVVTDAGGLALPNSQVQYESSQWDSATQTSVYSNVSVVTNASGYYELLTFAGTTTVTVRPPNGSNASTSTASGVVLSGDTTRDIALPAPTYVSGIVRGYGGQPVGNANVYAYTSNWQFITSTTTDADGKYSIPVGAGTINLQFNSGYPPSAQAPAYWNLSRTGLTISGSTTLDVDLPVVKLSGVVTDADGALLSTAQVQVEVSRYDSATQTSTYTNVSVYTNNSGYYELLTFAGSATITVRPPSGANASTLSTGGVSLTGDTTRDIVLPAPTYLTGVVRGYGGQPVANANIYAYTSNWQFIMSAATDADGKYSLPLSAGVINLLANSGYPPSPAAPASWSMSRSGVTLSGNTTMDVNLPVVKVTGTVTDSNGAPVPNVSLQAESSQYDSGSQTFWYTNISSVSDAQGHYTLLLFAGSSNLTVRPPVSSGFATSNISGVHLTGDLAQRIILQRPDLSPPQIVSGPVVVHLSDDSVSISWVTNEASDARVEYGIGSPSNTVTDADFTTNHTITLTGLTPVSTYTFRVGSTDPSGNGPTYSPSGTFTTQGAPGDVTPPVISDGPTVVFRDQTSAIIQWTTDEPASGSVAFGLSASLGASVGGPAGKFAQLHSIRLTGLSPDTQYFAQVTSVDPDANGTSSSVFTFNTLAVPDTAAPVITSGPTVASATDTKITVVWTTDEPSTSGVSYNDGTQFFVVSDTALVRNHEITLSSLSPLTTYHITVSSTDAVGNGPTLGGPVDGATKATPDTTAPVISNLQVTEIAETTALITWVTDERSDSAAAYGTAAGAPDNSKADIASVTEHRLTLTGLHDGTEYFLTVSSTDASANTATSAEIRFKTQSSFVDMPPSAPGAITAPAGPTKAISFSLSWGASTDDVGLVGYDVLRDGTVVGSVAADVTTFTETGLAEGSYIYTVRATDTAGHTAVSAAVTVVVDRTPPLVTAPGDIVANAIGTTANVDFTASASDTLDGPIPARCSPHAGSFPVGVTQVTCSADDRAGNQGSATFTVTVRDVTAPALTVPGDQSAEATGPLGAVVSFDASAEDLVDGPVTPTCSPASGDTFALGPTVVTCRAVDAAGNEARRQFTVTVYDRVKPTITAIKPSQAMLWPPNHQMVPLTLFVSATDLVDQSPVCSITGIASNEPTNGLGDGDTGPDWNFNGLSFALRAERGGGGSGRIYTITARCADASGNASVATTTVSVPKSQSNK